MNKSCPTPDSHAKAESCLKALKKPEKHVDSKEKLGKAKNFKNAMCQQEKKCFKELVNLNELSTVGYCRFPANCQANIKQTHKTVCQCAKKVADAQGARFDTQLKSCIPAEKLAKLKQFKAKNEARVEKAKGKEHFEFGIKRRLISSASRAVTELLNACETC